MAFWAESIIAHTVQTKGMSLFWTFNFYNSKQVSECALHFFIVVTILTEITLLCHQYTADAHVCLNKKCELMIWERRLQEKKHTPTDPNLTIRYFTKFRKKGRTRKIKGKMTNLVI